MGWIIFWIWIGINIAGFAFSAQMYLLVMISESEKRWVRAVCRFLASTVFLPSVAVALGLGIVAGILRAAAALFSRIGRN